MAASGSKIAVVSALAGNTLVAIAKFTGFFMTGSGAILAEAIHTVADVMNQFLLFIGIQKSEKSADSTYAYGYQADRYIWALISAVGIFFLGCGVTLYHGIHQLLHPTEKQGLEIAVYILIGSFIIEFIVLMIAWKAAKKEAAGRNIWTYLKKEADPSLMAVVLEDSAACLGVLIALASIGLTKWTGQLYWDAIGSILIAILLGFIAIYLVIRNRELLLGPSVPPAVRQKIEDVIKSRPSVESIADLRTRVLDTGTYRVKADIRFDGDYFAKKQEETLLNHYNKIDNYEDFRQFSVSYADEIINDLADEINFIEQEIQRVAPRVKLMDIEAD